LAINITMTHPMRTLMRLVEAALQGEIIEPDKDPDWLPSRVSDPKNDRSWESHQDADTMDITDYGDAVDYDTLIAFLKRNKDDLWMKNRSGERDAIGVTDSRSVWIDQKKIERALYATGYHDTECYIDKHWDAIDAETDRLAIQDVPTHRPDDEDIASITRSLDRPSGPPDDDEHETEDEHYSRKHW
jgi:hypothetical protein